MVAPTVRIAGHDRSCDTTDGMRISMGRTSVREKGRPSSLALTVRTSTAAPLVAPFDAVEVIDADGTVRFRGTVAEVDLQHPAPGSEPAALQQIAAVGPLASWGNSAIGDEPWPQETIAQRATRVAALIAEPLVVQGGQEWEVVRLDVDDKRARTIMDDLADSVGGFLYDFAGTVYLQALTARAVDVSAVTWLDEPLAASWEALDASVTWASEDTNPYIPIDVPGCWVRWAPAWAATSEIATAVRLDYGKPSDWEATYNYVQSQQPPASGALAFDNAGSMRIHHTDADGADRAAFLASVVPGTIIRLQSTDYAAASVMPQTDWVEIDVTPMERPASTGPTTVAFKYAQPYVLIEDTDASAAYGRHQIRLSTQLAAQGDALTLANLILQRNAKPLYGFPSVSLDIARMPAALAASLMAAPPGTRVTLRDLPSPAPQTAFSGVIEGTETTYGSGGAQLLTLHVSAVEHSLAVPTWEALAFDHLWADEPPDGSWETELV